MKEQRWGHAPEEKPERWFGSFATMAEAIEAGHKTYSEDETFYVCSGNLAWGPGYMPTVDELEEMIWSTAYEDVGELAEDFPDITEAAKLELDTFLKDWAARHVIATFWVANPKTTTQIAPRTQQRLSL